MFLLRFYTKAWTLAVPLTILVILTLVLDNRGAMWCSYVGVPLVMLANAIYIIFWRSKKRWNNASAMERAGNLFTFKQ